MNFIKFIFSKIFLKQLIIAFAVALILLFLTFRFFRVYTMHGKSVTVPDLEGYTMNEVIKMKLKRNLKFIVIDSVFNERREKGSIIYQDPAPNSSVKKGRKIYLTVVAMQPEKVVVPNLKDLSLRQAISLLEVNGLMPGDLKYVPDIAKNAILDQKMNGKTIEAGKQVEKGSTIDLVLGLGESSAVSMLPLFIGQRVVDARINTRKASLNLEKEVFMDDEDIEFCRVYKQSPKWRDKKIMHYGTKVTLWYKSEKDFDFKKHLKDIVSDSTKYLEYFE